VEDAPTVVGQAPFYNVSKNTVLFLPTSSWLAQPGGIFSSIENASLTVDVTSQPDSAKASLQSVGGFVQFIPRFGVLGRSIFGIAARTASGLTSDNVSVTVDVLSEQRLLGACVLGTLLKANHAHHVYHLMP
jgi:hypothetical protein